MRHKLTVRGLEQRIAAARDKLVVFRPGKPTAWQVLERDLSDHLACHVVVTADKSGKGELRVKLHSLDELDGVLAEIGYVDHCFGSTYSQIAGKSLDRKSPRLHSSHSCASRITSSA